MIWTKRLLGAILCLSLLPGCWDRTELNELAITSATSVDLEKGKWILSYQVIVPSAIAKSIGGAGGTSSQVPVVVYSTTGNTIKDAVSKSYLEAPRKLYFAHTSVLVIGEQAAKEGFAQMIDLYLRNPDSRETVSVVIANGDGRSILEQLLNMDTIPGQGIQRILEKEDRYMSLIPNVKMYDLTMQMLGPGKSAIVPEIIISGGKEVTTVDQLQQTTMTSKLRLGRAALIKEEKLVGWLNHEQQMGAAFLSNKVKSSSIPFSCEDEPKGGMDSNFVVSTSKTKITPKLADGQYELTAYIKVKGRLNETNCKLDLVKPENIKKMEENIAKEIEKDTKSAWEAIVKADADVLGFSGVIMRKYPKQWKQMKDEKDSLLKKIKLTVKVEVTLDKVGLSNKGYNKLKED